MKRSCTICHITLLVAFMALPLASRAYDFAADGIYYNIISADDLSVEVTYEELTSGSYSGLVTIPESVTYNGTVYSVSAIGEWAFRSCGDLTGISIPDCLTEIGDYALYQCTALTDLTLGENVVTIGSYAFDGCTSLASITFPDGLETIGKGAFYQCTSLTSITIPDGVGTLGSYAFYLCSSLSDAEIGEGITVIDESAFQGCTSLTGITIGENITSIGSSAFYGCRKLTEITLGSGVTSIGNSAFKGCTGLTEVTIGENVTDIDKYAFNGCSALSDVYSLNATPPTCASSTCFGNYSATLHVPEEAVDTYSSATVWKKFASITGDAETTGIKAVGSGDWTVSCEDGYVTVKGLDDGKIVSVYSADGTLMGRGKSSGGTITLKTGSGIAILRIGEKAVKVAVK